jgi:phosphoribosylcarboxyaminoimidazole (NCAIR) mutase
MAIGPAGARNAGIFAAQILATSDATVASALAAQRVSMAEGVVIKAEKLRQQLAVDGF